MNVLKKYYHYFLWAIITGFMLFVFVPKMIDQIQEQSWKYLFNLPEKLLNWHDDPSAFFICYYLGAACLLRNHKLGAGIIIAADIIFFASNLGNHGTFIFTIPTLIVALVFLFKHKKSLL